MEITFQKIILTIAVIGLIVMLVIIGLAMANASTSGVVWPPVIGTCPDYWLDLKGDGAQCQNIKNLGNAGIPSCKTMDFTQSVYTNNETGLCNKYQWANACGVTWDGITYGVDNPCNTTSDTTSST